MIPMPRKYKLVAGSSEGGTSLNAFDGALLAAGVGNLNLLKVSSVLPPGAAFDEDITIPPGSLVPIAFGTATSDAPGTILAAAVAVGIPIDGGFGMIMELAGEFDKKHAEELVRQRVTEAFAMRSKPSGYIKIASAEHKVQYIGCTFAGVLLWY